MAQHDPRTFTDNTIIYDARPLRRHHRHWSFLVFVGGIAVQGLGLGGLFGWLAYDSFIFGREDSLLGPWHLWALIAFTILEISVFCILWIWELERSSSSNGVSDGVRRPSRPIDWEGAERW